jgi:hypothetical protein
MESFDYNKYVETFEKFINLMPKLSDHVKTLDEEDLLVLKEYFEYQAIVNQRMSKKITQILFMKKSREMISKLK